MSWLTELEALYDAVQNSTSIDGDKPIPIYHICNNACMTVLLDGGGNFITAEPVDKKNKDFQTCMPCTESAAQSTIEATYPLCDTLEVISGDYAKFIEIDKQENKDKKHALFMDLLQNWCKFSMNKKLNTVFSYLKKNCLISDLISTGLWTTDEIKKMKGFVRWSVEIPGDNQAALWNDKSIQQSWIDYYDSLSNRITGFCYADGEIEKLAKSHPSKIRNSGDKAKIISSNDTENYTFRGRFVSSDEACQISSHITQKAHNALRWIIDKQGERFSDGLTVVTWNRAGKKLPFLGESSLDLEKKDSEKASTIYQTAQAFAEAINKRLTGYYGDGKDLNTRRIMLMVLNAATAKSGRMSILQYRELDRTELINSLNHWYGNLVWYTCYWQSDDPADRKNKKGHYISKIGTPSPETIAQTAYGERVKNELVGKTVQRILPCITDSLPIPSDIEIQCIKSASNLLVIDSYGRREQILGTACAVYKYNHSMKYKEEFKLALEEDRKDRDYLYGRLLAVAQQLENAALRKIDADRETNAVRYMQRFSMFPAETWRMLYEKKLPSYRRHLEPGLSAWFEQKIQDITALFRTEDYISNKPLTGEYLLGYQCQLRELRPKNTSHNESETMNNN
jgi:CRISPR-associated protein Csd1